MPQPNELTPGETAVAEGRALHPRKSHGLLQSLLRPLRIAGGIQHASQMVPVEDVVRVGLELAPQQGKVRKVFGGLVAFVSEVVELELPPFGELQAVARRHTVDVVHHLLVDHAAEADPGVGAPQPGPEEWRRADERVKEDRNAVSRAPRSCPEPRRRSAGRSRSSASR